MEHLRIRDQYIDLQNIMVDDELNPESIEFYVNKLVEYIIKFKEIDNLMKDSISTIRRLEDELNQTKIDKYKLNYLKVLLEMKGQTITLSENVCKLCFTNKIELVPIACGHAMMCIKCSEKLVRMECPICRKLIQKFIRLYI